MTKGSFYSHFANRDELIEAELERCEHTHSAEGMAAFGELSDPRERLPRRLSDGDLEAFMSELQAALIDPGS